MGSGFCPIIMRLAYSQRRCWFSPEGERKETESFTVSDARNARVARFGTAVFCVTYGTCVTKRRNESDLENSLAVTAVTEEVHTVFFKGVSPFVHKLL